jgi:hypothetical protein
VTTQDQKFTEKRPQLSEMKNFSFTSIVSLHDFVVISVKNICLLVIQSFSFIVNRVLYLIDKDRIKHSETVNEQYEELCELNILINIKEIRDDAMKTGHWNGDHEQQLNVLGNVLANTFDWEIDQVESYLLKIIETGPVVD